MFEFNGRRSTDPALGIYRVLRVFFSLLPDTSDRAYMIPGLDGAYDLGFDRRPREIRVQFVMKHNTPEELFSCVREIAAWLNVCEPRKFIYSYEPDKYYLARPQGIVSLERLMNRIGIVEVTFIAHDPYAYAEEIKTVDVFPATNAGSAPCPALITATMQGDAEGLRIELEGTDEYLLLDRYLDAGDVITIDIGRRLTTVNGVDARADVTAPSTYFKLPPGEFALNTTPAVLLTVEFRERWI